MMEATKVEWDKTKVDRLVSLGDHEGALSHVEAVLQSKPAFLPARMAQIRLALGLGEAARAADLSTVLEQKHLQNPWVWLLHVQSLVSAGRHEAAAAAFTDGLARAKPASQTVMGALNCLLAALPLRDQVPLLQSALRVVPGHPGLQLKLATRAHAVGQYRLAMDMLTAAEGSGPLPDEARRLRGRLYPILGTMDQAADHVVAEVADGAQDVETLARSCRYAAAAGRFNVATAALHRMLELHPLQHRTVYRLNRIFLTAEQDREIFGTLSAKAAENEPGPSWQLQFAIFALRAGQREAGRDILRQLSQDPAAGALARPLLAAIDTLGTPAPRPNVTANTDVRVVKVEGARATIFLFGDMQGGLNLLNERYLDLLFQKVPAHVVFLRDPYGRAYLNGIPELGDSEAEMHGALSGIASDLGGGRVLTLGGSIAGYAALRAGLAMGAERIISFAGFVSPGLADSGEPDHTRRGMEELFGHDPSEFDLRPALLRTPETRLVHVVGGDYPPDVERSRSFADLENVDVMVLPGVASHAVALPAVTDGTLLQLLIAAMPD